MLVPERFVKARKAKGWDQRECARQLSTPEKKITQQIISEIENGGIEQPRQIDHFAKILNVSIGYLYGETDNPSRNPYPHIAEDRAEYEVHKRVSKTFEVPFLTYSEVEGWLANPILNNYPEKRDMYIPREGVSDRAYICEIIGSSMESKEHPRYCAGYEALYDPDKEAVPGDVVLVKIDGVIKLREFNQDGQEFILQALNDKYSEVIKYSKEKTPILGVVIGVAIPQKMLNRATKT